LLLAVMCCALCLQNLTAAGGAAAALAESSRQVEALRLLYNEELSRASRLAVELSRATAAADKAAAAEDTWRRQLAKSDSRADNAEGMAGAMKATVRQLEKELAQEKARLEEKKGTAEQSPATWLTGYSSIS
jgi:chromosome segregation ATPase